jgi:hypothetical protein
MSCEHTCGRMYDLSCEACWEEQCQRDSLLDEYPGELRYSGDIDCLGYETDVLGGL